MSFLWKDDYKIDIEEIDEQHRRLFELGRELYRWIMTEDTAERGDLDTIMTQLQEYVIYHFRSEEEYMRKIDYIHYESHKNEHKFFAEEIQRFEKKRKAASDDDLIKEIFDFIFSWILNHILKVDMRLKSNIDRGEAR